MSEALNEEQIQKLIDAKVKERLELETAGLVENKTKILNEKKRLQESHEGLQNELSSIKSMYNELLEEKKRNNLKDSGSSEEFVELQMKFDNATNDLKSLQAKLEEANAEKDTIIGKHQKTLLDSAILKGLDSVKVKSESKDVLLSYFTSRASVRNDDGEYNVVMTGDDGIQKAPNDFIKSWSETEQAKMYIQAPINGGGGAKGGHGTGDYSKLSLTEKMKLAKDNPALMESLRKQ